MRIISGHSKLPLLLLHGGAGPIDPSAEAMQAATASLLQAARHSLTLPYVGLERVVICLEKMEEDPLFNAGFGAALQADGIPRLTAALMDGVQQSLSGVISLTDVLHPSRLALHLQSSSSRVLTAPGHELLARRLQMPVAQLVSPQRFESWQKKRRDAFLDCDTVGVVVWEKSGVLHVGTSTGGRGSEEPGRVSDSATVAGTYASRFAAVSATGIGEQIVDDALAARLETRVRDGLSLEEASRRCYAEAIDRDRKYGWIAADGAGNWCVAHTTASMSYIVMTTAGTVLHASFPSV